MKTEKEICRICLTETDDKCEMQSIFDTDEENIEISTKISDCSGLIIQREDNFPEYICIDCNNSLIISYQFRKVCQLSDKKLRVKLEKNYEEEFFLSNTEELTIVSTKDEIDDDVMSMSNNDDVDNVFLGMNLTEISDHENCDTQQNEKISNEKPISFRSMKKFSAEPEFYICEICGNFYNKKYQLRRHIEYHKDRKPFECEICQKKFRQNNHLARHMRSHTGQKPHACRYCDRHFSDLSTKVKHERSHTDERPYKCETCGKAFRVADTRNKHMTVHTGEKAFGCDLCGSRFSRKDHLRTHLKSIMHQSKLKENKNVAIKTKN